MKIKNSKTSVQLMLNTYRKLNNGKYPLVFQLIHSRRKKLIYSGYHVRIQEFDTQTGEVRRCPDSDFTQAEQETINAFLQKEYRRIRRCVCEKEKAGGPFTVDDLLDKLVNRPLRQPSCHGLLIHFEWQIKRKRELGKEGIATAYCSTLASLKKFLHDTRRSSGIRLSAIDCQLVCAYEDYLYSQGISENTVNYYLRNFRTVYNRAMADDHIPSAPVSPFATVHTRPCRTMKRALSHTSIRALSSLCLSDSSKLAFSRDLYLFSFYAQGMAFVDIAYLKKENIREGVLIYARHKSRQLIRILVTPQMQMLIDKYAVADSEYVFPILNVSGETLLYLQYRLALGNMNRHLKRVACLLGMDIPLTTYTARHTWATMARDCGAPISAISAGLGHTSEEMTRVYLRDFDVDVLARINKDIFDLLKPQAINKKQNKRIGN